MPEKKSDSYWMQIALAEAAKGKGRTSPNPMVGAVLVKGHRLLAKGYHRRAGLPHAEIEAMSRAKSIKGATLYVTLEPCCHTGKRTPPCTASIVGSGIRRVVIGTLDPNPKVSGRGARLLKKAGIATKVGVLKDECTELNRYYNYWIRKKTPYVILKSAMSLDGRIALKNGVSKWITGPKARERVHELRSEVDAILVGIGTVLADDPRLTARLPGIRRQPARVILDPHFKIPLKARLLKAVRTPIFIFIHGNSFQASKAKRLERLGAGVVVLPGQAREAFDLNEVLRRLGRWGFLSLLVEGGAKTWTEFYKSNLFQEWWIFVAPKVLGGDGKPLLEAFALTKIPAEKLKLKGFEQFGSDLLFCYEKSLKR